MGKHAENTNASIKYAGALQAVIFSKDEIEHFRKSQLIAKFIQQKEAAGGTTGRTYRSRLRNFGQYIFNKYERKEIDVFVEEMKQGKHYILGDTKIDKKTIGKLKLRNNYKLRTVLEMLLNHSSVKEVQQKPVVIQWLQEE